MLKCVDLKSGNVVREKVVFPFSYGAYCCLGLRVSMTDLDVVQDLGKQAVKINGNSSPIFSQEFRRKK